MSLAGLDKRKRRVFEFTRCARLYAPLDKAAKLSRIIFPTGSVFHMLRHSHAIWKRLYANADTAVLIASGLWKSRNAASVYDTWTFRLSRVSPTCSPHPHVRKACRR